MAEADQIEIALGHGDVPAAMALARAALARGDKDPFVRNLVAWQLVKDGNAVAAEVMIRAGLTAPPYDPGLLTTLGLALRRQLRFSEALRAFDAAIAVAPDYPAAWLERGFALHQGNSLRLAEASFRRAAALDPTSAPALAGVASIAAAQGEAVTARDFASRALAVDPGAAVAHCALACCDIAAGQARVAATRLREVLATPGLSADDRSAADTLLGDALTQLDGPAQAIAAYNNAKADLTVRFPLIATGRDLRQLAEGLTVSMQGDTAAWPRDAAEFGRPHAFLLGFPRSGTTLVETILASVPGVETLEELPTLAAAEAKFLLPADGLAALASSGPAVIAAMRAVYWRRVADFGVRPNAWFLDMDPMKTLRLPLIGRLFATAPVVVMRRDPRDVVLSCFRQNFAASAMAREFTTLERSAAFYDVMMRLQHECLSKIPNPVLELRYEELIADFDGVTQRLCGFLGLPWLPRLRDFGRAARLGDVRTASVGQVRRRLYDGSNQWRMFSTEMAPVLPLLARWVAAFGYPES